MLITIIDKDALMIVQRIQHINMHKDQIVLKHVLENMLYQKQEVFVIINANLDTEMKINNQIRLNIVWLYVEIQQLLQ